jgi:UV DNA damage endonuclease
VLVSPNENVVKNTITDLTIHADVFDFMGLSRTPYNKINIHCNGVYGDKISAMDRFCKNFERLPESVQTRLTVENDDKATMYSVKDLMYIHERIGIPIVFDYHHHKFNTGDLSEQEALELAMSTWPKDIVPVVHYSESKAEHELNESIKPQAHSDIINQLPNTYGKEVDVMVEAKNKEIAIQPFIKESYEK